MHVYTYIVVHSCSRKSLVFTPERVKQSTAASTLQHHWKRRQSTVKQKRFEDDREQAVLHLQSALRGHIARRQMVERAKLGQGDELRYEVLLIFVFVYSVK